MIIKKFILFFLFLTFFNPLANAGFITIETKIITSLENEDYELKIEGVVNVLSRFELKKQHHFEPKPHPKPFHPKPHGPKPGHPLPHELGHHPHEPGFEHPRPPVHGEHPEPSRPHEGPKH